MSNSNNSNNSSLAAGLSVTTNEVHECGAPQKSSRSVSFGRSGQLAYGLADRTTRILDISNTSKDLHTLTGHNGAVTKVRFHPVEHHTLLTAATDNTIRLWDVRQPNKSTATVDAKQVLSVSWGREGAASNAFVVTERSGKMSVFERRKASSSSARGAGALHVFDRYPIVVDTALLFKNTDFLIGGISHGGEGMADLGVWRWRKNNNNAMMDTFSDGSSGPDMQRFPAHAGPIYDMHVSPDGSRLATAGSDALIGLWDTDSMVCTHTIARPTKPVRSVAFSSDGRILASASDDNDVLLVETASGSLLSPIVLGGGGGGGGGGGIRRSKTEEVCWHPTSSTVVACARSDCSHPVALAKLTVTKTTAQ